MQYRKGELVIGKESEQMFRKVKIKIEYKNSEVQKYKKQ